MYRIDPKNWDKLTIIENLTADLLPVVGNSKLEISPNSTITALGKIPSKLNYKNQVVGFPKWTEFYANNEDIKKWRSNKNYGICIQTRTLKAIDIDITNKVEVQKILDFVKKHLGVTPAIRSRGGSASCLIALKCPTNSINKRVFKTQGGAVELLSTGQQFIAHGLHIKSQTPYVWNGEPFLTVSSDKLMNIWEKLIAEFAVEDEISVNNSLRKKSENLGIYDPFTNQLENLGVGSEGQLFIECPFKEEHTQGGNYTSTVYFPAGTRGYGKGHFKCLHSHCINRKDIDFIEALGLKITPLTAFTKKKENTYTFLRNKTGEIRLTTPNLHEAIRRSDMCGFQVKYDEFLGAVIVKSNKNGGARPLRDVDYSEIKENLEHCHNFKILPTLLIREAVRKVAFENVFDSAKSWVNGLIWDGIPRVEKFFIDFLNVENTEYHREIGRYMWSAMAARASDPGCQVDMAIILIGNQGLKKSESVKSLVPDINFFVEIDLGEKEDDLLRKLKGKLVAELGEMKGFSRKKINSIKAFISRGTDSWIPKFVENSITYPRRTFFIGTSNDNEIFMDKTGNRRWLPVQITKVINKDKIVENLNQLWAEGTALYKKSGIQYSKVENLAKDSIAKFMVTDLVQEFIENWLHTPDSTGVMPSEKEYLFTINIAKAVQHQTMEKVTGRKIGEIMSALGYEKTRKRIQQHRTYVWIRRK